MTQEKKIKQYKSKVKLVEKIKSKERKKKFCYFFFIQK